MFYIAVGLRQQISPLTRKRSRIKLTETFWFVIIFVGILKLEPIVESVLDENTKEPFTLWVAIVAYCKAYVD